MTNMQEYLVGQIQDAHSILKIRLHLLKKYYQRSLGIKTFHLLFDK